MSGAEGIHPGYGFYPKEVSLQKCAKRTVLNLSDRVYKAIDLLGSKTEAKILALENKVPVVPGTEKPLQDFSKLKNIAKEIGYPILIKASAGGGKGMRIVREEADIESSLRMAQNEAKSSFGDDSVFIEKYRKP